MNKRGSIGRYGVLALLAGVLVASVAQAQTPEKLRVCADPDNLPFSKAEGPERGLYVELAELVAERLSMPIEYVWWLTYYQRRALRNTILEDGCDAVFALPADAEYKTRGLVRTRAFIEVGYAVVGPPGYSFGGLADLKGKRVAVQYGSTPQVLLAGLDGLETRTYRSSEEVFAALDKGEVDAGFLWGPVAGYENQRRHANRWRLTPVAGKGLGGEVAVAVRKDKEALAANIDRALGELQPQIKALAAKYGFPAAKPVVLARAATRVPAAYLVLTAGTATAGEPATAGRVRFNDVCSHCHGTDGASPIRERDLRRLTMRYDAQWREQAGTTIRNGRSDAGMPAWKDLLSDSDIEQVLGFLATIQK